MPTGKTRQAVIIGVGAVGCRLAADIRGQLGGHRYLFIDTDGYSLGAYPQEEALVIGEAETDSRGTGKRPEMARRAAAGAEAEIKEAIGEADVAVVVASFGGGTGAGAGPLVSRFARELGATSIIVALDPFAFESSAKVKQACEALLSAGNQPEAVVRIPCTLLPGTGSDDRSFKEALAAAEEHASEAVAALVHIAANPGMLGVDFGDLRRVLCEPGGAVIGVGRAEGERRVEEAIRQACNSSFLDAHRLHAAANVMLHVAGDEMLSLREVEEGAHAINAISRGDYLLSVDVRPGLGDEVVVTVLLSGFSAEIDDAATAPEHEAAPPPGAFVYEGVNIDVPTFLRRERSTFFRPGRLSSSYHFGR